MFRDRPRRDQAIGRLALHRRAEIHDLEFGVRHAGRCGRHRRPPGASKITHGVDQRDHTKLRERRKVRRKLAPQLGAGKRRERHQHPHLGRAKDLHDQIGLEQRIDREHHAGRLPAPDREVGFGQVRQHIGDRMIRADAEGVKRVRGPGDLRQ